MNRISIPGFLACILVLTAGAASASDALISPFAGSELLHSHESRFAQLPLFTPPLDNNRRPGVERVEGRLTSHIYRRPEGVSTFEVYKSYLAALEAGGFDILLDCAAENCNLRAVMGPTYQTSGVFGNRDYGRMPTGRITYLLGWVEYYISAQKVLADRTYYALILISSERGLYSVDVLETATREQDTVTLSEELLRERIDDEGKAVLEGLYFETGSDRISDESAAALDTIASYLEASPDERFYVVGHTDDVGSETTNVALSNARAIAVVAALERRGVDAGRLVATGVGPYSPVASNRTEPGRAQNRRVELVLRLRPAD